MQLVGKVLLIVAAILLVFFIVSFTLSTFGAGIALASGAVDETALGRFLGALLGDLVCIAALQRVVRRLRGSSAVKAK